MYLKLSRVPAFLKWLYPQWYVWDKKTSKKTVYLTFDDGPVPELTEFVLDTLSRKRKNPIPATFFCIGDNVRKHPEIFKRIYQSGHSIGNHTQHHLNGWKTSTDAYIDNVRLAEKEISTHLPSKVNTPTAPLFRPPYGKIKRKQARVLKKLGYTIIMYRVIAFDWDAHTSPEQCLDNVIKKAKNGDIIVFHDSVKAFENMKYALPRAIAYFEKAGFTFGRLE
ncbi:polysaccharide deacetylase family protein [uncultured Dokdonia sp.]|uniref:polysaccharide deacetylase family protein n=1 Tax=uncultured Dokdonia sp. TaxID=575653 RepID=UPI0026067F66|nr:polysaccharide deacetylase family protein [uncultured Dokdonia sp.]